MYIDGDMIVVSIRAHQYKLALRRQVLRIGDQEPGTTIQARAAAEGNNIENIKCYNNVHETDEEAFYYVCVCVSVCVCVCLCVCVYIL